MINYILFLLMFQIDHTLSTWSKLLHHLTVSSPVYVRNTSVPCFHNTSCSYHPSACVALWDSSSDCRDSVFVHGLLWIFLLKRPVHLSLPSCSLLSCLPAVGLLPPWSEQEWHPAPPDTQAAVHCLAFQAESRPYF